MTTRATTRPTLPRSAWLFIASVVAGGAVVAGVQAFEVIGWSRTQLLSWVGLVCAISLTEQFQIPLHHRTEIDNFSLTDAVWVAGLLLAPGDALLLAVAVGIPLGQGLRRLASHKILFNTGQFLLGIAAAELVFRRLGSPPPEQPKAWLAATVAMAAFLVVNTVAMNLVIALVEGTPFLRVSLHASPLGILHWAGNTALGVVTALVWVTHPLGLPLVAVPVVLSYLAYRGWLRSLDERRHMADMARAADSISERGDLSRRIPGEIGDDAVAQLAATLNRMLDRLEASFQREQRFLSETSHDLRTPITICRGHLEVLAMNPTPDQVRETVDVVMDELRRMTRLVDDMTTLARLEEPEFLVTAPVDLDRLLAEVAGKAAPMLDGRLRPESTSGTRATVHADPQRLTQALINLLANAAVHTPPDTPVRLRLIGEAACWRFEVVDGGGGLSPEEEDEVFEPFRRGRSPAPGSGLGLAIVRGIAEAHGGSAGVDSRPGKGATFWMRIPR